MNVGSYPANLVVEGLPLTSPLFHKQNNNIDKIPKCRKCPVCENILFLNKQCVSYFGWGVLCFFKLFI